MVLTVCFNILKPTISALIRGAKIYKNLVAISRFFVPNNMA